MSMIACKRCRDGVPHDIPHGTPTGFEFHGCRQDCCRAAHNARNQRWRARNPGENAAACKRYRQRLAERGARTGCARCGIPYERTRRAYRQDICVDCRDIERGIA